MEASLHKTSVVLFTVCEECAKRTKLFPKHILSTWRSDQHHASLSHYDCGGKGAKKEINSDPQMHDEFKGKTLKKHNKWPLKVLIMTIL